jgi:hypothetical protein
MVPRDPGTRRVPFEDPSAAALRAFRGHLELEEIDAARGVFDKTRGRIVGWRPPPTEWLELIGGLIRAAAWDDAVRILQAYVDEIEDPAPRVRLKLAQLLLQRQSRPARALKILAGVPVESLPPPLRRIHAELTRKAGQALEEGPLELGDEV